MDADEAVSGLGGHHANETAPAVEEVGLEGCHEVPAPAQPPAVAPHDLSADVEDAEFEVPVVGERPRLLVLSPSLVPLQEMTTTRADVAIQTSKIKTD